ncbi:MAG: hypothetical protein GKR92_07845 [Gammaproteobacteria bacterium]|nr:MAG: hypothetical protein GKR92_07845 [Gammaproteobacteria bacterium]
MDSTKHSLEQEPLVNRTLVNFKPDEYERIKTAVEQNIDVVARTFCESELSMLCAIRNGDVVIGTVNDHQGAFCIYIEFQGRQALKPVHVIH